MDSIISNIVAGGLITKDQRQEIFGTVAGGAGSMGPEKYQRKMVIECTGVKCPKTNARINLEKNTLEEVAHPNKNDDGFEYTEDFDGVQAIEGLKIYVNFKCIVGKGGAQTRSLREVYLFVSGQLKYMLKEPTKNTLFANILDGDEAHANMGKFKYLLAKPEYASVRDRVYVGDLKGYFAWLKSVNTV
jgi:hypothetical protein